MPDTTTAETVEAPKATDPRKHPESKHLDHGTDAKLLAEATRMRAEKLAEFAKHTADAPTDLRLATHTIDSQVAADIKRIADGIESLDKTLATVAAKWLDEFERVRR